MKINIRNIKLTVIFIIITILILVTILFINRPTQEDKLENKRIELITTFKKNTELFISIAKFIQDQEGDSLSVTTPFESTNGIEVIYGDAYRILDLDESSEIYKKMNSIVYEFGFIKVFKIHGLIRFKKPSSKGIEQGIVYSPSGDKPRDMYSEPLEDNWYYYLANLE
jgi:hypothetical protein